MPYLISDEPPRLQDWPRLIAITFHKFVQNATGGSLQFRTSLNPIFSSMHMAAKNNEVSGNRRGLSFDRYSCSCYEEHSRRDQALQKDIRVQISKACSR